MNRELYDVLVAVRIALERVSISEDPIIPVGTSVDRPTVIWCDHCGRCLGTDPEFVDWQQWLHRMGWRGETQYDLSLRGWLVAAWREDRVVGALLVPDYGRAAGYPTLADAYRETLDRIERGTVVKTVPGAILKYETGWWRSESQETPSCASS